MSSSSASSRNGSSFSHIATSAIVMALVFCGTLTSATKPPGHVAAPREADPHPPRYAYGYAVDVVNADGPAPSHGPDSNHVPTNSSAAQPVGQGHQETRYGDNTHGNYYVNFADGLAQQSVEYVADDWGYHPVVRYSSHNDHSHVSSHFALGESAVERLRAEDGNHNPQHMPLYHGIPMHLHLVPPAPPPPPSTAQQPNTLPSYQYNPEHLQIIGVIPTDYPSIRAPPDESAHLVFPLAAPLQAQSSDMQSVETRPQTAAQPQQTQQSLHTDIFRATAPTAAASSGSELLQKTHNLINGFDVIDINHSAESVAQNTLFQAAADEDQYDEGQRQPKQHNFDAPAASAPSDGFATPIIVDDEVQQEFTKFTTPSTPTEVSIIPGRARYSTISPAKPHAKQINLQIFDADSHENDAQYLKETVAQQNLSISNELDVRIPEAPSRAFLRTFNAHNSLSSESSNEAVTSSRPTEASSVFVPQTYVQINKDVNIKTILLDQEHSNELSSNRGSKTLVDTNSITYVTTEHPKSEPYSLPLHDEHEQNVEIQQQVLLPLHHENHSDQQSIHQIVNDHIASATPNPTLQSQTTVIEKFIDRPVPYAVPVERIVEKQVNVPYAVAQVVEKIVDREVEKIVEKPVPYPYPVEVQVKQYVDRPYPVDRVVEKEVRVPYAVEKIVDRPVHVEKIVEKPVEKIVDRPYPVEKIVEKYIDRPIPVEVQVPVAVPYAVYIPNHLPFGIADHNSQHPQNAVHSSHVPSGFLPLPQHPNSKPIFYSQSKTPDYHHQHQQQHHNHQHPAFVHHKSPSPHHLKHVLLPPVRSLPSHLHFYHNYANKPPTVPQSTSTQLRAIQHHPTHHQHHYRPIYGVPATTNHLLATQTHLQSVPTAAAQLQHAGSSYAGSFGYAPIYRDDYNGPPPPPLRLQLLQQQQQQQQQHQHPAPAAVAASVASQPMTATRTVHWSAPWTEPEPPHAAPAAEQLTSDSIQSPQVYAPNAIDEQRPAKQQQQHQQKEQSAAVATSEKQRRNLNFGKSMHWENGFRPPLVPSVQTDEHGMPLDVHVAQ